MITLEFEAEIVRLFHQEKWKIGTIARQMKIHNGVVKRVLARKGEKSESVVPKKRIITPFIPFVKETLEKYPRLSSRRLYEMLRQRGYPGGPDHFRREIGKIRPTQPRQAFLRLSTLIGEQAQVDWGYFGKVKFQGIERRLSAFVMVLSWSRQVFVRFFLNEKLGSFLEGHRLAFEFFGGVPRVILYDNLKSAVLNRVGRAIQFQPEFLDFAMTYRYESRPVGVRKAWEKGRVERSIRYLRESFFAAREWKNIGHLNELVHTWCTGIAGERQCPEESGLTVSQAFEKEKPRLLSLPPNPFPTFERSQAVVGKWPFVRFDRNDYSVPHTLVGKTLAVLATAETVEILDGAHSVAHHLRLYGKGMVAQIKEHHEKLVQQKRAAGKHQALSLLRKAVPESQKLLELMAARGDFLPSRIAALTELFFCFGAEELGEALREVLSTDSPHLPALRQVLDRRLREQSRKPPIAMRLPEKAKNIDIRPHSLALYDLKEEKKHG